MRGLRLAGGFPGDEPGLHGCTSRGLDLLRLVAASGSVKLFHELPQLMETSEGRHHVLSVLRLLEAEPSLLGISQNFVAIAERPDAS
jgi:hypothetical protein